MATVRAVPQPPAVPTAEGGAPALPPFPRDGGCGPGRLQTAGPPTGAAEEGGSQNSATCCAGAGMEGSLGCSGAHRGALSPPGQSGGLRRAWQGEALCYAE